MGVFLRLAFSIELFWQVGQFSRVYTQTPTLSVTTQKWVYNVLLY